MADQSQTLAQQNSAETAPHLETPNIVTWIDIYERRNAEIHAADAKYNFDSPPEMIAAYQEFKEKLRHLIAEHRDAGKEPHEVEWPAHPDAVWQPSRPDPTAPSSAPL
jgi:hypothetical protein